jgi:NhaA family Na+:H+ antiporter
VHPTIAGVAIGLVTRSTADDPRAPATRWEHRWRPVSAAVAVPLFALLAAGVEVSTKSLASLVTEPLALGIMIGLVIGKAVGVFGGAYLTARFTRAELAPDLRWVEVFSVALLAGIGFTVALLVSDLAFGPLAVAADQAKTAVLLASIMAAVLAAISLARRNRERRRVPVRVRAERRRRG